MGEFAVEVARFAEVSGDKTIAAPAGQFEIPTGTPLHRWYLDEKKVAEVALTMAVVGQDERTTDLGNARRLVRQHGSDLLHCREHRKWYVWDGSRFREDQTGEVFRRAKQTIVGIYQEAADATDSTERKNLSQHAMRSETDGRIKAMVAIAETEPEIAVRPDQLDANRDLLNVLNGTIDLTTLTLRPHDPRDLITKLAPVEYDPSARSVFWDYFLRRQIPDEELRLFAARVAGYVLSGRPVEDMVPFVHGPGASGKTTLAEGLRRMLGDYARTADFRTFLKGRSNDGAGHTEDLARLEGARLVVANEVPEGAVLDEATLKKLSGGEKYVARNLHRSSREIEPQFTVLLVANDRPKVRDDDDAVWRRLAVIPFDTQRPVGRRYKSLRSRLIDPNKCGAAILAWAIEGLADYRHGGLRPPEAVRKASAAYQAAMNPVATGGWIEECCDVDPDFYDEFGTLWDSWQAWAKDNLKPYEQLTKQEFQTKLTSAGYPPVKGASKATRIGLRVKGLYE